MGKNVPRTDESSFDENQSGDHDEFGEDAGEATDEVDEKVEANIEDGKSQPEDDTAFGDEAGPIPSER
jgi:hypothetical protein